MSLVYLTLSVFLVLYCSAPSPSIAGPYIEFGTGVTTRGVVEEGFTGEGEATLVDPATGVQEGNVDSTRILAEFGWTFGDRVQLYGNIGGIDLKIDEFDNFGGDVDVMFGGGLKVNWYTSPNPSRFSAFTDVSALTFSAEDRISSTFVLDGVAGQESFSRVADEKIRWTEYTVKLGVSMVHPVLDRPYGGIRLSRVDGTDTVTFRPGRNFETADRRKLDLDEASNFGLFAGTMLFFDQEEKAGVNLEISLIDEASFSAMFRLNF